MDDLKKTLLRQINILKGQMEGVKKMIEEDKNCFDIVTQVKAIKSGVNKIGKELITKRFTECMDKGKKTLNKKELESLLEAISKN